MEDDNKKSFILGIDLGTTSVKVCLMNTKTKEVTFNHVKTTIASLEPDVPEADLQDPSKIYGALHSCMNRIPRSELRNVIRISICGQMHGILLWKRGTAWRRKRVGGENGSERFEVPSSSTSPLYTWQDGRCSPEFLRTLPEPESHLRISSGFGCATLFWLMKYEPDTLTLYDRAGTIMDFVISMLTGTEYVVTSVQNAASFGYFNTVTQKWNTKILENRGFPVHLLPKRVVDPYDSSQDSSVYLCDSWFDIPVGTPISASLGDLQCSVMASIADPDKDAVLNISTSAQMAFIKDSNFVPSDSPLENQIIEYFPYFGGRYLAVAASLTGGNALAQFVKMIQRWVVELGLTVTQSKIWETVLAAGINEDHHNDHLLLNVIPLIYGERHCPDQRASVSNVLPSNLGLGSVTKGICRGIVENLATMMKPDMLYEAGISRIVASGACLLRNPVLKAEVQELYKLPVDFVEEGNACVGAAMAALQLI